MADVRSRLQERTGSRASLRSVLTLALGVLLAVGIVVLAPARAVAAVPEVRMQLPRTPDRQAPYNSFATNGSSIVVGPYQSNDAGQTWVDSALPRGSYQTTDPGMFMAAGHLVGYTTIQTGSTSSYVATDYDIASGTFTHSATPLPSMPQSMNATWALFRGQLGWTAYDFTSNAPESALSLPAGIAATTPAARLTAGNGILWIGKDAGGMALVAYAPSPAAAPSAWVRFAGGGSTGAYSVADVDSTTLRYVAKLTDGLFFCTLPLADLTSSAHCISADPANESTASVLSRRYGSWSLIATGSAVGVSAKAFVWSGDIVTRVSLPGNAPVAYASVGDTPYVVLAGPSNTLNRLAPDGTLASPSNWPTKRVAVSQLALAPDRAVGAYSNSGTTSNVFSVPVSSSGFGRATNLPSVASQVATSAGRTITLETHNATSYDRNQVQATMTANGMDVLAASGPYILAGDAYPNIWLADGSPSPHLTIGTALLGPKVMIGYYNGIADDPDFGIFIDDASGAAMRLLVLPSTPGACTSRFFVWGDLVALGCGDRVVSVYSLKTGQPVAIRGTSGVNHLSPVGIGDGYVVVFDSDSKQYGVWRLADDTITPLPDCRSDVTPATDGVGHVVCASSTELIWRDFSALSTSAPRVLGVLAASSVDFGMASWTLEIDTTKPLKAGSLVITAADGSVVKTLSTPTSADGSLRLAWNGRDDTGKVVDAGTYTYTLRADAQDGTGPVVSLDGTGTATGTFTGTSIGPFVRASYQDFLGRSPSDAEVAFQVNAMATGRVTKLGYLTSLANSDEWLSTIVTKMYADTLGRTPDPNGLAFWINLLRNKTFTVADVASRFYSSDEYYTLHAGASTQTWVTNLYAKLLNRTPDPGGLQFWINHTNDPTWGRDKVAYNFYQSEETRKDRVQAMYEVLLNREPDIVGWPFWTQRVLTTGDIALAYDIANSQEYWDKAATRF